MTLVVSCLVRNAADEVLLVRHFRRGWELPQGRVEPGERLHDAVSREVREEAGVEMEVVALAAVWSKVCTPPATIFGFLGRHTDGAVVPSDETPEVGWYTPDDALNLVTHRVNRDRLLTLLNHGGVLIHCTYQARPFLQLGVMEVEPSALAQTLRVIVDPSEIGASVAPSSPLP